MKTLLRGLCLIALAGVLIVNVALAGPIEKTVTIPASKVLAIGPVYGDSIIYSTPFFVPSGTRYAYLAAIVTDTSTGTAATSDSVQVALQKGLVYKTSDVLAPDSCWDNVVELNPLSFNKTNRSLSMQRYLSPDSCYTGPYQIGGMHRWAIYAGQSGAGAGQRADTMLVAKTLKLVLECEGNE